MAETSVKFYSLAASTGMGEKERREGSEERVSEGRCCIGDSGGSGVRGRRCERGKWVRGWG
jgi:hypothetical protein